MRIETFGRLQVRLAGGTDGEGRGDGPLVVLLHGYGAPGGDLVGLAPALATDPSVRFAFPEAPLTLENIGLGGARAWWNIDTVALERAMRDGVPRDLAGVVPEGMLEARELVL